MATQSQTLLTEEEYLARERKAEFKSEYWKGEMFAMSGASKAHVRITGRIWRRLQEQLEGRDCESFAADLRVRVEPGGLYTYPDLVAVCGEQVFLDKELDTLLNPTLICEILSPTTEAYDRGKKFEQYRSIPSLREYVLVDQESVKVESFLRQEDGSWLMRDWKAPGDEARLASIGCVLKPSDIYEGVLE